MSDPFDFRVEVTRGGADAVYVFDISLADPTGGSPKRHEYRLDTVQHEAYLDLFAAIARDFGTRMPRNRAPVAAPTFRAPLQPLLTRNLTADILYGYGDPAVLRVETSGDDPAYYLVVTSNDAPNAFPILRSLDLQHWEPRGFVFPDAEKPRWAADGALVSDFWAPELHEVGGEFRVYFAARARDDHVLAIGVARSDSPDGPFVADAEPMLRDNVIDPHLFVDRDGEAILFWKRDSNDRWPSSLNELLFARPNLIAELFPRDEDRITASLLRAMWPWVRTLAPMERFFAQQVLIEATTSDFAGVKHRLADLARPDAELPSGARSLAVEMLETLSTPVFAQRLSADGSSVIGERWLVLENDLDWEAHLVEGIWVSEHEGRYYLFYAGNDFSTAQYGIGVAIAESPFGPYQKMATPILRSTAEWSGPGHPSVANGPDGQPQLFLHAFYPEHAGYKEFRALLTVPIAFEPDRVVLREPSMSSTSPSTTP